MTAFLPGTGGPDLSQIDVTNVLSEWTGFLTGRQWMATQNDANKKDVDKECEYPTVVTLEMCLKEYRRSGVARRAVGIFADDSWAMSPDVYVKVGKEIPPWEEKWNSLLVKLKLWHELQKLDKLSGIGRFAIMVLGLADGRKLSEPVAGFQQDGSRGPGRPKEALDLAYVQCYDEGSVRVSQRDNNQSSARYNQPIEYELDIYIEDSGWFPTPTTSSTPATKVKVHWTRVFHLAGPNRRSSNVFAEPILESIFNYVQDTKKIGGGSAEMFWKGGFPGLAFEADPTINLGQANIDKESLNEQIRLYALGLKRYLNLVGVTAKSLAPQVADPTNHLDIQLKLIAMALGIPYRIFLGSEAAHLASTQDIGTWNKRLDLRRREYIWPFIILEFINKLISLGVLPEPEESLKCEWPDLNAPAAKDAAEMAVKKMNVIQMYITGLVWQVLSPIDMYVEMLGYSQEKAEELWANAQSFTKTGVKLLAATPKTPDDSKGGTAKRQDGE